MKYAIADYLTDEQKQFAISATYPVRKADGTCPRTAEGCCPLGVALWPGQVRAPYEWIIRARLKQLNQAPEDILSERFLFAPGQFTRDWDAGRITDLRDALGVECAE